MSETPAAAPKQRSPLFYILIGCGGLAGLICLGGAVVFMGIAKVGKDFGDGLTDPAKKKENAIKQLGGIPEGYEVVASFNMFVMQMTMMTDAPAKPDGGFDLSPESHTFMFFDVMANENNKGSRDFLMGKETDSKALARSGINIDQKNVIKRGQLSVDGRKVYWVASRGRVNTGQQGADNDAESLNTAILFDCPGDQLRVGIWSQQDPDPAKTVDELPLAGTVADEGELVRFLKPMNPCGK
ncbi:MAG: hypothetical protein QM817_18345 [Archangium sp.]